ncbi:unnamed protein product [Diamesa hyperborea]
MHNINAKKLLFLKLMGLRHKLTQKVKSIPIKIFKRYPVTRGMLSYSIVWPLGNVVQQKINGESWETIDWVKVVRFGMYGTLVTAPLLYSWVRLTTHMYPNSGLRIAMAKALLECVTYTPFAMCLFFYSLAWIETFSAAEACAEVRAKFFPTYKVAICIWPFLQTINFSLIPERNRVFFVSCFSFLWTIFLAYMKQKEKDQLVMEETARELALLVPAL